ncbi:MAG: sigma-70 family RNA polymerase sigma factor [Clostridia bacterium]
MTQSLIKKTINNDSSLFILAQSGDQKARDQLFVQNMRMCNVVASKYVGSDEFEDLLSVAYIGLMKAIDNFDVTKEFQFSSFAYRCIGNEILMHIRKLKPQKLKEIRSLDEPLITSKSDESNELTLQDTIADKEDFDGIVLRRDQQLHVAQILRRFKQSVPPRQYEMLLDYYGLEGRSQLNQTELAEKFNISRSYISRILDSSRKTLSKYLSEMGLNAQNLL